jgi:hypothetical protein
MAIRFRKSIKLAPGIRMNLSGAGVGWTLGPRGATVGISKRGARLNTSFMGFSSSQKMSGPSRSSSPAIKKPSSIEVTLSCSVDNTGNLHFKDSQGNNLPEHLVEAVKKKNREVILKLIQRKCDDINESIEHLGRIHLDTPDCKSVPAFVPVVFDQPEPTPPQPRKPSLLDKLFKKRMQRLNEVNAAAQDDFTNRHIDWQSEKVNFSQLMQARKQLIEVGIYNSVADMEIWLEDNLKDITWPRETAVSFDIVEDGHRILLDVDLPELEQMPSQTAVLQVRELRISLKDMSATAVQKLYMSHVHAVAFRLAGETFAALPRVQSIVLSGYSQRPDKATGLVGDEYLFSIQIIRKDWEEIDFNQLSKVDVVESLTRFELRRQMSKTGIFKPIIPFGN